MVAQTSATMSLTGQNSPRGKWQVTNVAADTRREYLREPSWPQGHWSRGEVPPACEARSPETAPNHGFVLVVGPLGTFDGA